MERKKKQVLVKSCEMHVCSWPFPGDAIAGAPVDWLFGLLALNLSRRCRSSVATAAAQAGARLPLVSSRNRPVRRAVTGRCRWHVL